MHASLKIKALITPVVWQGDKHKEHPAEAVVAGDIVPYAAPNAATVALASLRTC
jgi:hypothetical protein